MFDIATWYSSHEGVCPNCQLDMNSMPYVYNIWPHFTGGCVCVDPSPAVRARPGRLRLMLNWALLRMGL